jgi:predicted ATPase/DNA-binding CsgD family transcriptional regulator
MSKSSSVPTGAATFLRVTAVPWSHQTRHFTLPATIDTLFGRDQEIAEVAEALRSPTSRLLVLTGPGGVGKTRLAIASATVAAASFRDGALFVPLAPIRDPALVATTTARAAGMRETGAQPTSIWLAEMLADRDLLLLLDNFEHLLAASDLISGLLKACPTLTILMTSRTRPRLTGERDIPVRPLTLPPQPRTVSQSPLPGSTTALAGNDAPVQEKIDIGVIGQSPAVQLFIDRARAIDPSFGLTVENAPAVAEICRRVDGLPLAIELAAARAQLLPPGALLARLDQRLPLLEGGSRDQPERLQTMRQAIAWSYELLPPDVQETFQCLAVFVGGFGLDAAQQVCAAPLDQLTALVDQSLLLKMLSDDEPRCAILETIREFALELLASGDGASRIRDRHAQWCLTLASTREPDLFGGRGQVPALRRLEEDLPNLRAAFAWLLENGKHEAALRLAAALARFMHIRGHNSEGREWLETTLARAPEAPRALRAWALLALAMCAVTEHSFVRSEAAIAAALPLVTTGQDPKGLTFARTAQSILAFLAGRYAEAAAFAAESEAVAAEIGSRWDAHIARFMHAKAELYAGNVDRAETINRGLIEAAKDEEVYILSSARHDGGTMRHLRGDYPGALSLFDRALRGFRDLGESWNAAMSLEGAAAAAVGIGHVDGAVYLVGAADALRARIGTPVFLPDRPAYDKTISAAREALGETRFAEIWAAGRAATLDQAIACTSELAAAAAETIERATNTHISGGRLTPREREVLALLAESKSDKEIGAALFISHRTAMWHVANLLEKLGVATRSEAADYAMRHGLA